MKFNGEIIELFGEKLILHERSIGDAFDHNEFAEKQINWNANSEIYFNVLIFQKALQFNISGLPHFSIRGKTFQLRPFRYKKLNKLLSIENIYKNLGIGRLRELVEKIRFDLEKQPRETSEGEKISNNNLIQLVVEYSKMNWDDVNKLSVSEFTIRLEQAFNMLNTHISGKFGTKTQADEYNEALEAYNFFYPENDTVN